MKILYIAPFCFGLEESFANSFEKQGVQVKRIIYGGFKKDKTLFEQFLFNFKGYGLIKRIKQLADRFGLARLYYSRKLGAFNKGVLQAFDEFQPDAVLVIKGETLYRKTLEKMNAKGAKLISYYWDDPFLRFAKTMVATEDVRYQNVYLNCSAYDYTFVYDPSYIQELKKLGAKNVEFLMDWYEPELYEPLSLSTEEQKTYKADIAFVGSPYPNRVELLSQLGDFDLGIWGPFFRWREFFESHPTLKKAYRGEAESGAISAKIYNASKINLNIHDTAQCLESVNNRTFQILACSAFEMVDDRKLAHQLFKVGEEIETFSSADDLKAKLSHYLSNEDKRRNVAQQGLGKARFHSADQRARQVMEALAR